MKRSSSLSFLHYNAQSLTIKVDILEAECLECLIFWRSLKYGFTHRNKHSTFHTSERTQRQVEQLCRCIIVNVKEHFHYKRRLDLGMYFWIEIMPSYSKRILLVVFYLG
jgi:hypothetical protein